MSIGMGRAFASEEASALYNPQAGVLIAQWEDNTPPDAPFAAGGAYRLLHRS